MRDLPSSIRKRRRALRRARRAGALGLLLSVLACAPPETLRQDSQTIIYGEDDRTEAYAHPDSVLVQYARQSALGVILKTRVDASDPEHVVLDDSLGTLGQNQVLCEGEPLADQPIGPRCSGVLIAPDVVLTAGHCVTSEAACQARLFMFGYYYEGAGQLRTITSADLFGCKRLLVRAESDDDFALVQLDREATPAFQPVPYRLAPEGLAVGSQVSMISHPSGLPTKIDSGGRVLRNELPHSFIATLDAFGGSSGAGVFDADHQLVGLLVKGGTDFEFSAADGCQRVVRQAADPADAEGVGFLEPAITALCASGNYVGVLCGTETSTAAERPSGLSGSIEGGCSHALPQAGTPEFPVVFFSLFLLMLLRRSAASKSTAALPPGSHHPRVNTNPSRFSPE